MKNELFCYKCGGEIERKGDLVVTTYLLKLVTYHNECYAKELKSVNKLFIGEPINTKVYTLKTIFISTICGICGIVFLISKFDEWRLYFIFIVICLILITYRVLSIYLYEKKL